MIVRVIDSANELRHPLSYLGAVISLDIFQCGDAQTWETRTSNILVFHASSVGRQPSGMEIDEI